MKIKIKRSKKIIQLFFTWGYYKKKIFPYRYSVKVELLKSMIGKFSIRKDNKIETELLPGSKRKKNKIVKTYLYRFWFVVISFRKIEIMEKFRLRSIFKKMGAIT